MPRQFKQARLINKLKMTEAAEKLGISQPTLSAWEGERKSPSIDGLEKMSVLYGVTTDFLLGRSEQGISVQSVPIAPETLPIFHGKPVWSAEYGWMLVDAGNHTLLLPNGQTVPFADAQKLFTLPQLFSEPSLPSGKPLILSYLRSSNLLRYGWNPFLQTQICGLNCGAGIRSKSILSKMSMGIGFIWIPIEQNGLPFILNSNEESTDTRYNIRHRCICCLRF